MNKVLFTPWRNQGLSFLALSLYEEGDVITHYDASRLVWPKGKKRGRSSALKYKDWPIYVFEVHNPYPEKWEGKKYFIPMAEYLDRNISSYKGYDIEYIALSDFVYNRIKAHGVDEEKIHRVHWVTPFKRLEPKETDPERIVIKHISSGVGYKNRHALEAILRAAKIAIEETDNLFFDISVQHENKDCLKLIGEMREKDEVGITIQNISRDEVREFYKGADLSLYPSKFEGFGVTLMESLTYGVPAIVSNIPPFNEFLIKEKMGRIVKEGKRYSVNGVLALDVDHEALADTIIDLAKHPKQVEKMKQEIVKRKPFGPNESFTKLKEAKLC